MIPSLTSLAEFADRLAKEPGLLLYFSHEACQVCTVLKPKVHAMIQDRFPAMAMYYVDMQKFPEIAGQNRVFAAPTIIVYTDQKEQFRLSRSFGISELESLIDRFYDRLFS